MLKRRFHPAAGFTLIEVIVALTIFSILVAAGVPTFQTWLANTKVRATADALQNGIRTAQTEALRRSRQVVFSLTNSPTPQTALTAAANGSNWSVNVIAAMADGSDAVFVQSGVLTATNSNVTISNASAEICFNSLGRLVANANTGVAGGSCALPTLTPPQQIYNITAPNADHPLRVWISLGGQIHMCDPSKVLSMMNPDGC